MKKIFSGQLDEKEHLRQSKWICKEDLEMRNNSVLTKDYMVWLLSQGLSQHKNREASRSYTLVMFRNMGLIFIDSIL